MIIAYASSDGNWVTINGVHVLIGANGKITKGPAKFIGSTVNDLKGQKMTDKKKAELKAKYGDKKKSSSSDKKASTKKSDSKEGAKKSTSTKNTTKKVDVTKPISRDSISKMSDSELKSAYEKATSKITTYADGSYKGGPDTFGNSLNLGKELRKRGIEAENKMKTSKEVNKDYINSLSETELFQKFVGGDVNGNPYPRNVQLAMKKRLNEFDNDDDHLRSLLKGRDHSATILNEKPKKTTTKNTTTNANVKAEKLANDSGLGFDVDYSKMTKKQIEKGIEMMEEAMYTTKDPFMSDAFDRVMLEAYEAILSGNFKKATAKKTTTTKKTTTKATNTTKANKEVVDKGVIHYDMFGGRSRNEYRVTYSDGTSKKVTKKEYDSYSIPKGNNNTTKQNKTLSGAAKDVANLKTDSRGTATNTTGKTIEVQVGGMKVEFAPGEKIWNAKRLAENGDISYKSSGSVAPSTSNDWSNAVNNYGKRNTNSRTNKRLGR